MSNPHKVERFTIACLFLARFSFFLDMMIMMPLGSFFIKSLGLSTTEFGLVVSSYSIAAGASGLLNSLFVDRFNKKNIFIFFFFNFSFAMIACSFSHSFYSLFLSRLYAGFSGGILSSLIFTILSEVITYDKRAKAIGYMMSASSLAFIFGPPLSLYLASQYNWSSPFLFLGILSLIVCLLIKLYIPDLKVKNDHKKLTFFEPYKIAFTDFKQRNLLFLIAFMSIGQYSIIPYISPYLKFNLDIEDQTLALFLSTGGLFSIFSSIIIGKLSDKFGKEYIAKILILVSLLSIYLITNLSSSSIIIGLFVISLFFISITGRIIPIVALATNLAKPEYRSSFMTIQNSIQQFSSSFASFAASLLITNKESHIYYFDHVGYMAIIFSILCGIQLYRIEKHR